MSEHDLIEEGPTNCGECMYAMEVTLHGNSMCPELYVCQNSLDDSLYGTIHSDEFRCEEGAK